MTDTIRAALRDLGPAALARERRVVSVEGRSRGSAAPGEAVHAVQVRDLPTRMHARAQLSDRQFVAARRFCRLWWATRLDQQTVGGYGKAAGLALGGPDLDAPTAEDEYHDLMRAMPGIYHVPLRWMTEDRHPGVGSLTLLQEGLDWLADAWGIERDPDLSEMMVVEK